MLEMIEAALWRDAERGLVISALEDRFTMRAGMMDDVTFNDRSDAVVGCESQVQSVVGGASSSLGG